MSPSAAVGYRAWRTRTRSRSSSATVIPAGSSAAGEGTVYSADHLWTPMDDIVRPSWLLAGLTLTPQGTTTRDGRAVHQVGPGAGRAAGGGVGALISAAP